MEELFRSVVNDVAWQVNRKQADDPHNPIYQQMVRINEHQVPRSAWKGVQQMRSSGLAERSREPRGTGEEVNALAEGLKAVIEALILLVQRILGEAEDMGTHLADKEIPQRELARSVSKNGGPTP
jgi:hypothetical protein